MDNMTARTAKLYHKIVAANLGIAPAKAWAHACRMMLVRS